jgi:hypothetical protein
MIITRHHWPRLRPLRWRLPQIRHSMPRETARGFPRWLPLALHWKPASRRAALPTARGATVSHFNAFTTRLHARLTKFATTVLQQTIAGACAPAEKIYRSIERAAPLPYRAPTDGPMRAPAISGWRDSTGSLQRPLEWSAVRLNHGPGPIPPPATLDLPNSRRADERAPRRRVPWRPATPVAVSAAPLAVVPLERRWSPVKLAGPEHEGAAQPKARGPRARITHAEFFSRAPELIWPKAASPRRGDSQEATPHEPRVAGNDTIIAAAGARTTGVTQSQSAPESGARKPTRLSDLEPSFIDRLADDVIRRVERRARIERERRGL